MLKPIHRNANAHDQLQPLTIILRRGLMAGLWQTYRSLPRRQRVVLGILGITVGIVGPHLMPLLAKPNKTAEEPGLDHEAEAESWLDIKKIAPTLMCDSHRNVESTTQPIPWGTYGDDSYEPVAELCPRRGQEHSLSRVVTSREQGGLRASTWCRSTKCHAQ